MELGAEEVLVLILMSIAAQLKPTVHTHSLMASSHGRCYNSGSAGGLEIDDIVPNDASSFPQDSL